MVDQADASFSQRLLFVVVVLLPQIASGAGVLGDVQRTARTIGAIGAYAVRYKGVEEHSVSCRHRH